MLTTRTYDEIGSYPTSVIKDSFGSWTEACTAAGIDCGEKHGTRCVGPRGEQLESRCEREVAELLHGNGVSFDVHPPIGETNWVGDFYLPDADLWIEVDGYSDGDRPNSDSFEEKCAYFEEHTMEYDVVDSAEELEGRLHSRGIISAN